MINTDSKKTVIILNPAAGKGNGKKVFKEVQIRLAEKFNSLETFTSNYPGHIQEIAKKFIKQGFQRIISIGGDGTPFEIINGIYENGFYTNDLQLGMIPAGTGNSFLRDFDDSSPEKWVDHILKGKIRHVDLIEFSFFKEGKPIKNYYINILGFGLIADILKLTNEKLKFLGSFGYSAAVLIRLFKGIKNHIRITIDGESIILKNSALVISNSQYTGGEMKIAPMADTGDGKVDMVVFNEVSRRDIISIFANVFKGKHIQHPKVKVFSGREISIDSNPQQLIMADGELLGESPLKLKVLPRALKIIT